MEIVVLVRQLAAKAVKGALIDQGSHFDLNRKQKSAEGAVGSLAARKMRRPDLLHLCRVQLHYKMAHSHLTINSCRHLLCSNLSCLESRPMEASADTT
jgi:hypothetical protein